MWWRRVGGNASRETLRLACIASVVAIAYPSVRPELPVSKTIALSEFSRTETAALDAFEKDDQARLIYSWLEELPDELPKPNVVQRDEHPDDQSKPNFAYLSYYAYSEVPPPQKPADTVLASLKDIPVGTPIEEIKRAADAFGLDFTFMKTVARIESGFDPKQRTGSYIGLFQLSNYEFAKYGSGSITNARDNAVAAAYKFSTEGILFELDTHKRPTRYDRYLIHQQGTQGAAEHVAHPERIAWKSMCATEEGKEKGESWCKRAIWKNTLPTVKEVWKSVERLTSAGFVDMWEQRLDQLYAHYSVASASEPEAVAAGGIPLPTPRPEITLAASAKVQKQQTKPVAHVAAAAQHHKHAASHSSAMARSSKKTTTKTSAKAKARIASK
jgi:hypothetical protein